MSISIVRLALAAVVTGTLVSLRRQARQRRLQRGGGTHEATQAWESEGGALPTSGSQTGSQIGSDPTVTLGA